LVKQIGNRYITILEEYIMKNRTKKEFLEYLDNCHFYCLKRAMVFRLTNKTTKEVVNIPITKKFYGPMTNVIMGGMGWWMNSHYSTEIECSDGNIILENSHPEPRKIYKIYNDEKIYSSN